MRTNFNLGKIRKVNDIEEIVARAALCVRHNTEESFGENLKQDWVLSWILTSQPTSTQVLRTTAPEIKKNPTLNVVSLKIPFLQSLSFSESL